MIEPNKLYSPHAPELRPIAARQTLAMWRYKGRGPAYVKAGHRVLYRGTDLLAWLEAQTVETQ